MLEYVRLVLPVSATIVDQLVPSVDCSIINPVSASPTGFAHATVISVSLTTVNVTLDGACGNVAPLAESDAPVPKALIADTL